VDAPSGAPSSAGQAEALVQLHRNTWGAGLEDRTWRAQEFGELARLVAEVPVWTLGVRHLHRTFQRQRVLDALENLGAPSSVNGLAPTDGAATGRVAR
jgi:hypothetical protein